MPLKELLLQFVLIMNSYLRYSNVYCNSSKKIKISTKIFLWWERKIITMGCIICFNDSGCEGGPVTRNNVSEFILYVVGIPVSWWSKALRSRTLSSSEAECVALFKFVKEMIFMIQLLPSINISGKLPVIVSVDHVWVLFLWLVTLLQWTRHVDIRYEYFNEYVGDGS